MEAHAAFEIQINVVLLIFGGHDVQIDYGRGKIAAVIQFKCDGPQAVIVKADLTGKTNDILDFPIPFFIQLIMQVFANGLRVRLFKTKVIMKAARSVHNITVEAVQFVAGHNEQLLPACGSIKQTKQRCLIIVIIIGTEGLIKFIEQNHTFLVDGFQESRQTWVAGIHQNHWITLPNGGFTNHFCEQRFADAFITAEDHTHASGKTLEGRQDLFQFFRMNAIGFFCHADITPVDEEAAFLLVISDIESRDWQLIIASDAIIKNGELASSLNCFHFSSPALSKQNGFDINWCALQDLNLRPTDYRSVALPTELKAHESFCKRRGRRTNTVLPPQRRLSITGSSTRKGVSRLPFLLGGAQRQQPSFTNWERLRGNRDVRIVS